MSKNTNTSKRSAVVIRSSIVVGIARALRDAKSKTDALRVRVTAFRSEYGKNAAALLPKLRQAVRAELRLAGKDKVSEAKWNVYRVLLSRVVSQSGIIKARKAAAAKRVPLVSKATVRQLVAALEAKGYSVSIKK